MRPTFVVGVTAEVTQPSPAPAAPPDRTARLGRALDGKGRMQLPIDAGAATKLPAERDGALVTVFLPAARSGPGGQLRHRRPAAGRPRPAHGDRRAAPGGRDPR